MGHTNRWMVEHEQPNAAQAQSNSNGTHHQQTCQWTHTARAAALLPSGPQPACDRVAARRQMPEQSDVRSGRCGVWAPSSIIARSPALAGNAVPPPLAQRPTWACVHTSERPPTLHTCTLHSQQQRQSCSWLLASTTQSGFPTAPWAACHIPAGTRVVARCSCVESANVSNLYCTCGTGSCSLHGGVFSQVHACCMPPTSVQLQPVWGTKD